MDAYEVASLEDLFDYIEEHSKTIYVREQVDGVWCAVALGDLPGNLAIKHAMRFLREGIIPIRIKEGGN